MKQYSNAAFIHVFVYKEAKSFTFFRLMLSLEFSMQPAHHRVENDWHFF